MKVHIVSHTHWDREWCQTFQEYRVKLVKMMDKLLFILNNYSEYKYFTLDGQTIVLEDYLEIRPEKEEEIKKFVKEGKIFIGPWYLMPDEFLISGESIIRNLLIGDKISSHFGRKMNVGYMPDPFGHISQLSQILRGFNIDNAVLWRGISKNENSEYIWKAPDGSKVLLIHLQSPIYSGYSNGWYLSYENWEEPLNIHLDFLKKIAKTNNLLLMNGRDHAEPEEKVIENIIKLNKKYGELEFIHSNLEEYIKAVEEEKPSLETIEGELRNPPFGTDYLLSGVLSARVYIKQENFRICHEVERILEPISVLNYLNSSYYDSKFLEYLWREILKNHPHDSVCGCSIDEVHKEMEGRFLAINGLIKELERVVVNSLLGRGENIFIFNPSCWNKESIIIIPIDVKEDMGRGIKVFDEENKELEYQLISIEDYNKFYMDEKNMRNMEKGKRYNIALELQLPSLGFRMLKIERCNTRYLFIFPDNISKRFGELENEYLKVFIQSNGSLVIEDKETKEIYKNINIFEDGGDTGDEYNYCPPLKDEIFSTLGCNAKISLISNGKYLAEYLVGIDFEVPKDSTEEGRSDEFTTIPIKSFISLRKEEKFVRVKTQLENKAKNHRLRVLFESGAQNAVKSFAYTPFDIVERKIEPINPKGRSEYPFNICPFQNFMGITDEKRGLIISAKGLYEYEVKNDREKTIALTLLRAIGWLSKELYTRYNIAGPIIETPSAQCFMPLSFEYAVIPFNGNYNDSFKYAMDFIEEAKFFVGNKLPNINSLFEIDKPILLSAIKKAEKDEGIILRLANLKNEDEKINIKTKFNFQKVEEVNLKEEKLREIEHNNETIEIMLPKKKIITLKFLI